MSVQKLNRRRGKELERFVAKLFAGKRLGILGGEDVIFKQFACECKERKSFNTVRDWMQQANSHAVGKVPIVYYHQQSAPHNVDIVMMYAEDFKKLITLVDTMEEELEDASV